MTRRTLEKPALALILSGLILVGTPIPAPARTKEPEKQKIMAAEKVERRILAELEGLERRISRVQDRIVLIEEDAAIVSRRLDMGAQEVGRLERRLKRLKKYLSRRLRVIYHLRRGGLLQVLVGAESIPDLVLRYRYLSAILKSDEAALKEYSRRRAELLARQKRLKADRARLYRLRIDLGEQKGKLNRIRRKKTALLIKVHQQKELYLAMLRSREESRRRLIKQVTIRPDQVQSPAPPPNRKWADFPALKGKLPRPVPGPITGSFGRTRGPFNTYTARHGLIFATRPGTKVRAVASGQVFFTGWLKGYGNIIIIHHGRRYYTLTGGLAGLRPQVGQWIKPGQTLGLAPGGGDLKKKEIYFEVRHGGRALNPAQWLGDKPAG